MGHLLKSMHISLFFFHINTFLDIPESLGTELRSETSLLIMWCPLVMDAASAHGDPVEEKRASGKTSVPFTCCDLIVKKGE